LFPFKLEDGGPNDGCAGVQCKNIPDEGFIFPLDLDDVGNLNHWVLLGCGELASGSRTLDIETEYSERS